MDTHILLPIELIFNLLCACRRLRSTSPRALRQAMQARGLVYGRLEELPRLSFWVRLCQSACLLDEGSPPRPTNWAADWLAMPWPEQINYLVDIWQYASPNPELCHLRHRMLEKVLAGFPLGTKEKKELIVLQVLGICQEQHISEVGRFLLTGSIIHEPKLTLPWLLHDQMIEIPYLPDWGKLWQLEQYLAPLTPGIYPLTDESLRLAAQWGSMEEFQKILEAGCGKKLDPALSKRLLAQPKVQILSGLVLEFTDSNELRKLRGKLSFRRVLERIISPHHVYLDPYTASITIRRLQKAGLLSELEADVSLTLPGKHTGSSIPHPQFTSTEWSFLLSLLLLIERLDNHLAPPPSLAARISQKLPLSVRASAFRVAAEAFARIMPKSNWLPEDEPPIAPDPLLIQTIERAIKTKSSLDVLYHVPQRPEPEFRHLTPIAVEQRGLRYYLIAYCHSRRANRTFRLDRLKYLENPPL